MNGARWKKKKMLYLPDSNSTHAAWPKNSENVLAILESVCT